MAVDVALEHPTMEGIPIRPSSTHEPVRAYGQLPNVTLPRVLGKKCHSKLVYEEHNDIIRFISLYKKKTSQSHLFSRTYNCKQKSRWFHQLKDRAFPLHFTSIRPWGPWPVVKAADTEPPKLGVVVFRAPEALGWSRVWSHRKMEGMHQKYG